MRERDEDYNEVYTFMQKSPFKNTRILLAI